MPFATLGIVHFASHHEAPYDHYVNASVGGEHCRVVDDATNHDCDGDNLVQTVGISAHCLEVTDAAFLNHAGGVSRA